MDNKLIQNIVEREGNKVKPKLDLLDENNPRDLKEAENILQELIKTIKIAVLEFTWFSFLEKSGPDICIRAPFYPEDVIKDILRGYHDTKINALFFECNPEKIISALSRWK